MGRISLAGVGAGPQAITVASFEAPADVRARADYVCDGVNDEVEINAALTAAAQVNTNDSGMGVVELSSGAFLTAAAITIPSTGRGVMLVGKGWGLTSQSTVISRRGTGNFVGLTWPGTGGLANLTFVDYAYNVNTSPLIQFTTSNLRRYLKDCYIENDNGLAIDGQTFAYITVIDGCDIEGDLGAFSTTSTSASLRVTDSVFYGYSSGYAVDVNAATNNSVQLFTDCEFAGGTGGLRMALGSTSRVIAKDCTYWGGTLPAINVSGPADPDASRITGIVYGSVSSTADAVTLSSVSFVTLDLDLRRSGGHGVHLTDASRCIVRGRADGCSQATANTYSAVILDGNSDDNEIGPLMALAVSVGNKPLYGVRIAASTCDNTVVHGVHASVNTAGNEVSDAGTGTQFRDAKTLTFAQAGTLATGTGVGRARVEAPGVILGAEAMVNTAPTGASILVDVNKNGTTIYTTQASRVTVAAGANAGAQAGAPDVKAVAAGDYVTVDVDQVGSTVAGSDATVFVRYLPV